ncbi:MAG: GGDEF domain-containing protein [Selenomonadaceae bacterium]|nr:GGDEF domain-containing protein [Selenomonadaceae bacterium]
MSAGKIILLCIGGLLLNVVGSAFAQYFNLPVYLDSAGTIYIAALGGYVPGIVVGFLTNLFKAVLTPSEMYYGSVSIFVAIFVAFSARRGFFDSYAKVALLIIPLTLITSTCDLLIEDFLNSTNFLKSVNEFESSFGGNLLNEVLDKGLSLLVAVVLLKFSSPNTKESLRSLGRKQAPLSAEMKDALNERNYLSSSLRTKMLTILMLSSLFVAFSIALISYLLFKDSAIEDRIKSADAMDSVILSNINPEHVDEYIKHGRNLEEYRTIEEKLYTMKNTNSDIKFIYVYKVAADGFHVVFDLDTAAVEGDNPGDVVEFEEALMPYVDDLLAGRPIPPIITDDEYGYLLTLYKPLYDVNGNCQCYAAVDLSMNVLSDYARTFVIKLIALFVGCFIFIFAIGLAFVENNIVLPVNTMAYCARNFSYDSEEARERNIERMKSLRIKTGDEIENLYSALIRTTENLLNYFRYLQRAKGQVADMQVKVSAMDKKAHIDSLTGVKNKTSYVEAIEQLDKKIAAGNAAFCIVMVDVNYLKRVNDTYGHERGNEYLVNACRLVCGVFGKEHVYRVGGDEFVVLIEGDKVSLCKYFVAQFKVEMNHKLSNEMLALWEKVSAAIGVAFYEVGKDKTADEVFKRADKEMYANKLAMKAARTD